MQASSRCALAWRPACHAHKSKIPEEVGLVVKRLRVHEETLRGERFLFTRAVGLRVLARALMTCELLESTSAGGNVSLTPPHEYGY